jgi:uncharacterized protein (TIGR02466 family)
MSRYKEIWSTPIAEFYLEDTSLQEYISKIMQKQYTIGNNINVIDNEEDPFVKWILTCAKEYASKFYNIDKPIKIKRSWIEVQEQYRINEAHVHAGTDIIAIYYINPNEKHPELNIYDPRPAHRFNEVTIKHNNVIRTDCARHIAIKPEQYKLVLIPGYLLHGVNTNLITEPRLSLSMNMVIDR